MIGYNINPYDDELLYSILARYNNHTLKNNVHKSMIKLFGHGNQPACIDLPGNLNELFSKFFYLSEPSVSALIDKYTLYPFYKFFLSYDRQNRIINDMKAGKTSHIHNVAGINSCSLVRNRFPKYCPQCIKEATASYGEAYWRRSHNIPGVLVCPIHNLFLQAFVPKVNQLNFGWYASTYELDEKSILYIDNSDSNLLTVSKILLSVLNGAYPFDINTIDYKSLINRTSYFRGKTIRYAQLLNDMVNWYSEKTLKKFFPESSLVKWVPCVIRKPMNSINPVKHILLNEFLIQAPPHVQPTLFKNSDWDGPWNCINPVCESFGTDNSTAVNVFLDSTLKRTAATVKCKCGMIYKCSYTLYHGKKRRNITINNYGSNWKEHVLSKSKSGKSALSISRELSVSSGVILRFLKVHNGKVNDLQRQNELVRKRIEWVTLLENFEVTKITNAIKANSSLYKWLFNHDHAWLKVTHRLYAGRPSPTKLRLDWEKIDEQLITRISEAIALLRTQNFKDRITQNLISKIIQKERNFLTINKAKLPGTSSLLEAVIEPFVHYQIRRLRTSIRELSSNQERLTFSKIVKNSGLKAVKDSGVKKFLEDELRKAYCA